MTTKILTPTEHPASTASYNIKGWFVSEREHFTGEMNLDRVKAIYG